MPLTLGSRIGPYEIVVPLGAGAMGEVYRARDTRLARMVAIKVLTAADPRRIGRLEREARAISRVNHPHICALHDIGHQDGLAYLVMEYLEGETLAQRLERGGFRVDEAIAIALQICEALDAAHTAGVIHRDLKPGNVMLTEGISSAAGHALYPVDEGRPRPMPFLSAGDAPLQWSPDGRYLYVRGDSWPPQIERIDTSSGTRVPWRTVFPADPVGVDGVERILITPDGTTYCYDYMRLLTNLYVVDQFK